MKPLTKLDLPEETKVRTTVRESFSELLDELGELEAKNDINKVLEDGRRKDYYGYVPHNPAADVSGDG